jgi:hypothetical protein
MSLLINQRTTTYAANNSKNKWGIDVLVHAKYHFLLIKERLMTELEDKEFHNAEKKQASNIGPC